MNRCVRPCHTNHTRQLTSRRLRGDEELFFFGQEQRFRKYLEEPVWKRLNLVVNTWSKDADIRRVYGAWLVDDGVGVKWWPWYRAGAGNAVDAQDSTLSLRLKREL